MVDTLRTMNPRLRGAFAAACAALLAATAACSDDNGGTLPSDGGGMDSTATDGSPDTGSADAAHDASDAGTRAPDSSDHDAADATSPTMGDADAGAPVDASHDADATAPDTGSDGGGTDATLGDGGGGDADAASTALALCPLLDSLSGIDAGACPSETTSTCGGDRYNTWQSDIPTEYAMGPVATDCTTSQMFSNMTADQANQYGMDVSVWTLSFFGCPIEPPIDAGPYTYGLIPRNYAGSWPFTTADLQALSDDYVLAIQVAVTQDLGQPDLSADQYAAIRASLASLAAQVPGVIKSNAYSFNSCPADAGSDASDAGSRSDASSAGDAAADAPGGG